MTDVTEFRLADMLEVGDLVDLHFIGGDALFNVRVTEVGLSYVGSGKRVILTEDLEHVHWYAWQSQT